MVYTQSRPAEQNVSTPMFKPSVFKQHKGGVLTKDGAEVVQFGLIDILTYYDTAKVVEHRLKRLLYAAHLPHMDRKWVRGSLAPPLCISLLFPL